MGDEFRLIMSNPGIHDSADFRTFFEITDFWSTTININCKE